MIPHAFDAMHMYATDKYNAMTLKPPLLFVTIQTALPKGYPTSPDASQLLQSYSSPSSSLALVPCASIPLLFLYRSFTTSTVSCLSLFNTGT